MVSWAQSQSTCARTPERRGDGGESGGAGAGGPSVEALKRPDFDLGLEQRTNKQVWAGCLLAVSDCRCVYGDGVLNGVC